MKLGEQSRDLEKSLLFSKSKNSSISEFYCSSYRLNFTFTLQDHNIHETKFRDLGPQ